MSFLPGTSDVSRILHQATDFLGITTPENLLHKNTKGLKGIGYLNGMVVNFKKTTKDQIDAIGNLFPKNLISSQINSLNKKLNSLSLYDLDLIGEVVRETQGVFQQAVAQLPVADKKAKKITEALTTLRSNFEEIARGSEQLQKQREIGNQVKQMIGVAQNIFLNNEDGSQYSYLGEALFQHYTKYPVPDIERSIADTIDQLNSLEKVDYATLTTNEASRLALNACTILRWAVESSPDTTQINAVLERLIAKVGKELEKLDPTNEIDPVLRQEAKIKEAQETLKELIDAYKKVVPDDFLTHNKIEEMLNSRSSNDVYILSGTIEHTIKLITNSLEYPSLTSKVLSYFKNVKKQPIPFDIQSLIDQLAILSKSLH